MATSKKTSESRPPDKSDFSRRLREYIDRTGSTHAEVCSLLGVTPRALGYYLNGQSAPTKDRLEIMLDKLSASPLLKASNAQQQAADSLRASGWRAQPSSLVMERNGEYVIVTQRGVQIYPAVPKA